MFTTDAEILAPKWFGEAVDHDQIFIDKNLVDGAIRTYGCSIKSGTGWLRAKIGDYIIRDSRGKIYPCKKGEFDTQYEKVSGKEVPTMPVKTKKPKGKRQQ